MPKKILVVGAGSWGTALAIHLVKCGHSVTLWVHGQDTFRILQEKRTNEIYLPGFALPGTLALTPQVQAAADAEILLFAVPSQHFRKTFQDFLPHIREKTLIVSSIKGMETDTSRRISEIVQELAGDQYPYAVLSGPSFAREVAEEHPTAVVIGSVDKETGQMLQQEFRSQYFRLYYNPDVLGIEIGASVKNIIAIAAGVVSGLGYGYNTTSGLITRGLAEMNRLAVHLGANPATLTGLAGLGDLVLTCMGHLSRNRQVGVELGRGKKLAEIITQTRMVAEGVKTTRAIYSLSKKLEVSMPITEQVYKVLYEDHDPRTAILELMTRELKQE